MKYRFYILDVFSRSIFGGNQLAVLPEAAGITEQGMQKIAREFNFAETAFVLPPKNPENTCQVRIFTPQTELAFAGHPTVGAACALVMGGHAGSMGGGRLTLEEGVGPVVVDVERRDGVFTAMLTLSGAAETPGGAPGTMDLAAVLSLAPSEVLTGFFGGVGVGFCFIQLTSREAVDRARIDKAAWTKFLATAWSPHVFFFAGDLSDGAELYARMSAPALGIEEDPATGSACAALAGVLAARPAFEGGTLRLLVQQGVAMGRPSDILAVAHKVNGVVTAVGLEGASVHVASGDIDVPPAVLRADAI